jgi:hypothetical protein
MSKKKAAPKRAAKTAAGAAGATGAAAGGNAQKKAAGGGGPIKVRALQAGYYDNVRRREGDVFVIQHSGEFSSKWMERVGKNTPEKVTTGQEQINAEHDKVLNEKLAGKATGGANPLGAE